MRLSREKEKMMERVRWMFTVGLLVLALAVQTAPALALPTIDGAIGVGEWLGAFLVGGDGNEGTIPDAYDLSGMVLISELGGAAADDGLYVLITTYAAPSLVDLGIGVPRAAIVGNFDYDGNADFAGAVDRFFVHTSPDGSGGGQTMTVFDGTGAPLFAGVAGTHFALGAAAEYFIPASIGGIVPIPPTFLTFATYDNGGDPEDDRMPNVGFFTPIPEPGSLSLMGLGLLGLFGGAVRSRLRL